MDEYEDVLVPDVTVEVERDHHSNSTMLMVRWTTEEGEQAGTMLRLATPGMAPRGKIERRLKRRKSLLTDADRIWIDAQMALASGWQA